MGWKVLYNSCTINRDVTAGYKFAPIPTTSVLDKFENHRKLKLPKSYREFALLFGAGELSEFYRIATPLRIADDYELAKFNADAHGDPTERLLEEYGPVEFTDKFLFFCADGGGYRYAWKTDEITNQSARDYAIYEFPRHPKILRVAKSFESFILDFIMTPKDGWEPENSFLPFQIRE